MDGFLLDVSFEAGGREGPSEGGRRVRDQAVMWFKDDGGRVHALREPFSPVLFVRAAAARLAVLEETLPMLRGVGALGRTQARCGLSEEAEEVLAVRLSDMRETFQLAQRIDEMGRFRDHELFDVDLRASHRHLLRKELFPFARLRVFPSGRHRLLDDKESFDYPAPALATLRLEAFPDCPRGALPSDATPLGEARLGERVFSALEGGERRVLEAIVEEVAAEDPDVLLTRGGDSFLLSYLHARAEARGVDLQLGRVRQDAGPRSRGKSFFTYGRIKYRPPSWALAGRIHLDESASFLHAEAGLMGLVDLCRVSGIPLQEMARLGPGTAITAIQIDLAKREGRLVPWKKNVPESFKTARGLLLADRGGHIYEPHVGLHEDVVEHDFASLYPNVMVRRNISPEVILCDCCAPEDLPEHRRIPQLGTWTCGKRTGFIPRSIAPVVARRERFKRMRKEDPDRRKEHQERVDVYKWLLVTSFGYQGYRNAKFGRIECHEAIGAWGREILLGAAEAARDLGFEPVHGIVDSLWLARKSPGVSAQEVSETVSREIGIPFEYEGRYKWIVFLPTRRDVGQDGPVVGALNRYYGCFDAPPGKPNRSQAGQPLDTLAGGALKVRGVELRQHSTPPLLSEAQRLFLEAVARAEDAAQFRALLPSAIDAVLPLVERVRRADATPASLVYTNVISQDVSAYRSRTLAHAALRQLTDAGLRLEPGQAVRYVVRDEAAREPVRRVTEVRLATGSEVYDCKFYERQVARAIASLALPFGWDEARLADRWSGRSQRTLTAYDHHKAF